MEIYIHRMERDAILFFQMATALSLNYPRCRVIVHAHCPNTIPKHG
jgi:hypothetical protein